MVLGYFFVIIKGGSNPHNVGLLTLKKAVTEIEPAELPGLGFLDGPKQYRGLRTGPEGAKFPIVGYGRKLDWYRQPPETIYVGQRQFAESEYKALVPVWLHLSQNCSRTMRGPVLAIRAAPLFGRKTTGRKSWSASPRGEIPTA